MALQSDSAGVVTYAIGSLIVSDIHIVKAQV